MLTRRFAPPGRGTCQPTVGPPQTCPRLGQSETLWWCRSYDLTETRHGSLPDRTHAGSPHLILAFFCEPVNIRTNVGRFIHRNKQKQSRYYTTPKQIFVTFALNNFRKIESILLTSSFESSHFLVTKMTTPSKTPPPSAPAEDSPAPSQRSVVPRSSFFLEGSFQLLPSFLLK